MADDLFLSLRSISLRYHELQALNRINLDLFRGEIHALVGEHGAGKSSLGMIISGMIRPDSGEIAIGIEQLPGFTIRSAQKYGIQMVYQQNYLNDYFSVAENLFYTEKSSRLFSYYSRNKVTQKAYKYLSECGFSIDPTTPLKQLSLSDRAVIDILKTIYHRPTVLILDEALEKLVTESFDKILPILINLRKSGTTILFITHRVDDVYNIADRVSIVKSGEILLTDRVENVNKLHLVRVAYTQVNSKVTQTRLDMEFQKFLKYNEAILRHLPVSIIVVDNDNQIKLVNEHCSANFDLHNKTYLNRLIGELFQDNEESKTLIEDGLMDTETYSYYNVHLKTAGVKSVNNIKLFPILDGKKKIGKILLIEDVTEYDILQKQLILSDKLASVGLLAAGVAHEINNPLEIIYNYLSFIKYRYTDPELQDSVAKVLGEISSISSIVSNLASFSSPYIEQREPVDINDVVQGLLNLLQYNAKYQKIKIKFDPQYDPLFILGSKTEIKQVILNLIKNSFEAMPDGGSISISTSLVDKMGKSHIHLTLQDEGSGIQDTDPSKIFLPFYTTKHGIKNKLGLGLSITYRIIENLQGSISACNLEERGCCFTIDIPAIVEKV